MQTVHPGTAVLGGVLIGLAATLFLALNGRIAGNAGAIHGLIPSQKGDRAWRGLYLGGLVLGAWLYSRFFPDGAEAARAAAAGDPLLIVLGGILVGFGTRMGGGCTSGHGVCGIGRLSTRSFIATVTFILTGMLTVTVVRHVFQRPL